MEKPKIISLKEAADIPEIPPERVQQGPLGDVDVLPLPPSEAPVQLPAYEADLTLPEKPQTQMPAPVASAPEKPTSPEPAAAGKTPAPVETVSPAPEKPSSSEPAAVEKTPAPVEVVMPSPEKTSGQPPFSRPPTWPDSLPSSTPSRSAERPLDSLPSTLNPPDPLPLVPTQPPAGTPPWMAQARTQPIRPKIQSISEPLQPKKIYDRSELDADKFAEELISENSATPAQKDVVKEYRDQAARDMLPPAAPPRPLTMEEERAKAMTLAEEIHARNQNLGFVDRLKRMVGWR